MKINTKNYEGVITSCLIDDRENKRIDTALGAYAPLNPLKVHLDYGDYIFIGHNGIKVVWEYKTGSDFLNSISENEHLHNQVYDMVTHEDYTFVIVQSPDLMQEVDELYYSTGITINIPQINGSIAEFCTVSNVLFVQTEYQAFDLMMRVSGKIIQQKPYKYNFTKKTTNFALNSLSAMKGMDNMAEKICRELNLKTLTDLLNLTKEDLTSINGVGSKKADMILANIGSDLHERQGEKN